MVVLSAVVAVAVSGCSSNSVKPDPTSSSSSVQPTSTTSNATTATPTTAKPTTTQPTSTTPASPVGTIAIPKVEPQAQAAVNSYIEFLRAENYVGQDPGEIRRGVMTMYVGSKAAKAVKAQLDAMAAAGTAFRGNPDNPRVTLDFIDSDKLIVLNSCPLADKTDPQHIIKVSTGKTVVPPKQNPPPPYELRVLMFLNKKGHWVFISSTEDTSRTCTG